MTALAAAPRVVLSERQVEVLTLMAQGLDFPAIARHMQISVESARSHLKKAMQHLGAPNGTSAVALAIGHGLIPATAAIPSRGES